MSHPVPLKFSRLFSLISLRNLIIFFIFIADDKENNANDQGDYHQNQA